MNQPRIPRRGLWLGGGYVVLFLVALFLPENQLGLPAVLFKMMVGTLLWPWVILIEDDVLLFPIVGGLWFWLIGKLISLAATRWFPRRESQ